MVLTLEPGSWTVLLSRAKPSALAIDVHVLYGLRR
jgi:hypothetical protein